MEPNPIAAAPAVHEVFAGFPCFEGQVAEGFRADFLGGLTRACWYTPKAGGCPARVEKTTYPELTEQHLEWIDLLLAVREARDRFTMIELGAGWGRWVVRAALALRLSSRLPCRLVAVEAEPTHFRWMHDHFRDNGLDPAQHRLVEAAVGPADGHVLFATGNADGWYGQHIVDRPGAKGNPPVEGFLSKLRRFLGLGGSTPVVAQRVRCVSLATLLEPLDFVDLIDADIQGSEADVFEAAAEPLDRKVRRVHIGTHSREVEDRLRTMFTKAGWQPVFDYPCKAESATPWGMIKFNDGVQSWRNARL